MSNNKESKKRAKETLDKILKALADGGVSIQDIEKTVKK